MGNSHVKRINRKKLQNSFKTNKTHIQLFGGAIVQDLHHFILPSIVKNDKSDIAAIMTGISLMGNVDEFETITQHYKILCLVNVCHMKMVMKMALNPEKKNIQIFNSHKQIQAVITD